MNSQLLGRLNNSDFFVAIFLFSLLTCVLPAAGQGVRVERSEQMVNQRRIGWEHVLTDRDPNLSHWYWEPISNSYKQVQTRTIYGPTRSTSALNETRTRVKLSTKLPNPAATSTNNRSTSDLNGKLIKTNMNNSIAPPTVLTYGQQSKSPASTDTGAQYTQTKVAGKIVRLRDSNI